VHQLDLIDKLTPLMVVLDLNLLRISSFVHNKLFYHLNSHSVDRSKELFHSIYRGISNYGIIFCPFRQETRENKVRIKYNVSYCAV
jgi:hypothetical protein